MLGLASDAAEYGAGMMLKFDKNREKAALLDYGISMKQSLETCVDLPAALHMTAATLFATHFKSILHFPGKLTPKVIDALGGKVPAETSAVLTEVQDEIMKQINSSSTSDPEPLLKKLRTLI